MGHVIITTAILVVCFFVNADFVGKTCSQHHWNIVVSIYFWFCLQSKVSRKGRWSLPRMFFVAFVQFVSKLFFPKMYWDFNGWACNPAGGPQDPQGCNYCNYFFSSRPTKFKWQSKCLNEVPVSPKSVSVLRVCLLLLSLVINVVNALWHPHTPVLSTDEREIWAVKIVRSSCQRCKTWIFRIKISSIVWVDTY